MQRDDCPRITGGRGPCAHLQEVDPLYNYDPQIDKFSLSATRLLQGAFARAERGCRPIQHPMAQWAHQIGRRPDAQLFIAQHAVHVCELRVPGSGAARS
eukprot:7387366-Prymnesium_polylepis.1